MTEEILNIEETTESADELTDTLIENEYASEETSTEAPSVSDAQDPITDEQTDTIESEEISTEENSETDEDTATGETIESLKNEIVNLKKLIAEKENEQAKILGELGDFNRLFPDATIKNVPESVWRNVEQGVPLCAAYALYEKEEAMRQFHANEINRRNASLSAGKAGRDTAAEYFSPDEVRTMSQREVHENYEKIRRSMQTWR